MSSFSHVKIGDVAKVQSGYAFKSSQWAPYGVPVVKIANVKRGAIDLTINPSFVSKEDAEKASKFMLVNGDIVVGMTGYVGEVAEVRTTRPLVLNQRVGLFRVAEEKIDRQFFYYSVQNDIFRQKAQALAYGSAQPNISPKLIESIEIPRPPLAEQRRIAGVLGALDDLIELNKDMQANLWDVARCAYRKAVHKVEETAPLRAFLEFKYGKALPARSRVAGRAAVVSSAGIIDSHNEALVNGPGVIVGRKGVVGSVTWVDRDFFPIDTTFYIESVSWPAIWSYFQLESLPLRTMNTDSAVPGLNRNNALAMPAPVATKDEISDFMNIASPLIELASHLESESQTLQTVREELLPLLMSGKIRVREAEEVIDELVTGV